MSKEEERTEQKTCEFYFSSSAEFIMNQGCRTGNRKSRHKQKYIPQCKLDLANYDAE